MSLEINKCEGVGAELLGVDIAGGLTDNELNGIRDCFAEEGLVFFRDQSLSEEDHIAFARKFGEININRFFQPNDTYPEIAMVTKEPDQETNIGGGWHTDHSYDFDPALGSILVARELPSTGGDTWFASMYKAFDALSAGLQQTLLGLKAVHSAKHVFGNEASYRGDKATSGRVGNSDAADALTDPVHPVVIRHPLSNKPSLYVNPGFTRRIEGWTGEESAPLLSYLYEVAVSPGNVTKFQWAPGSVAFWDNRATWHFAQNDYQGERRVMHRITVEGCSLEAA